jgi:hypothetical protein
MAEKRYGTERWSVRLTTWVVQAAFWAFGLWVLWRLYNHLEAGPSWAWSIVGFLGLGIAFVWVTCQAVLERTKHIEDHLSRIERGVRIIENRQFDEIVRAGGSVGNHPSW